MPILGCRMTEALGFCLWRRVWAALALVCAGASAGVADTGERLNLSWLAMTESCLRYVETGERAVAFGGWHIAARGGGVCNGDPACEGDLMTFIGAGDLELGAVRVAVGSADWAAVGRTAATPVETMIGDRPAHVSCSSAAGVVHQTRDIREVHGAWIEQARALGRFVEGGVFAGFLSGPYLGCGYDGRPYQIEFSLHREGAAVFRLYFPAREGGAEGTGPNCAQAVS